MSIKFSELTTEQINNLTEEEFKNIPPEEKRSCYDCTHMKGYISWWCTEKQAIKARGTSIPGCIKCPFWEPKRNKKSILDYIKSKLFKNK